MKNIMPLIAVILVTFFGASAQELAKVEVIDFESKQFPFKRPILIYTPQYYEENTESDYDVVYVFDAQDRAHFDEVQSLLHYGVQQPRNDRNYIVVGVTSPTLWDLNHCRNNDFLPVPEYQKMSSPYYGSADKFKKFIKEELMTYINTHYRTSGHTLGIGHSLGASFVLDAVATDNLFDDCIAISPNLGWDNDRFANDLMNMNFSDDEPRFIYITMANEGLNKEDEFPESWRLGWEKVKNFISSQKFPENVIVKTADFPEYSHNSVVLPAHLLTLREYADYRYTPQFDSNKTYPVHIELTGEGIEGDIYITGNQSALANWNPEGVKMTTINDTTRVIDLNLRLPAEFKFTQGDWDSAIGISNGDCGNIRISSPKRSSKHYTL
ncbi:MAG: hypothetical protein K2M39_05755 [Muribaculaceae bacterium]|nr:hypothetical protein [Muribaculaceae bacterium]